MGGALGAVDVACAGNVRGPHWGVSVYLAHVRAENFRIYGSAPQRDGDRDASLHIDFGQGISVLVGENDSGKTAIVDAIRLCLLTTAADYYRITREDFHVGPTGRADTFTITCLFKDLTVEEQAWASGRLSCNTGLPPNGRPGVLPHGRVRLGDGLEDSPPAASSPSSATPGPALLGPGVGRYVFPLT